MITLKSYLLDRKEIDDALKAYLYNVLNRAVTISSVEFDVETAGEAPIHEVKLMEATPEDERTNHDDGKGGV